LGAVGEDEPWPLLFIDGLTHVLGRTETGFRQGWVPAEGLVFGDEDVGVTIASEVDEFEIGVAPGNIRERAKCPVCIPLLIRRALEESRRWSIEVDNVQLTITSQIQELLATAEVGRRGHGGHALQRGESGDSGFFTGRIFHRHCALVALVEPGAALLRQDP